MFRKALDELKTSAPLRNSDRRKLKQRILEDFGLSNFQGPEQNDGVDVGDLLVPDGLQSVKFTTHAGEIGVAYLSTDGDPLWFTLGKGNSDLIPSVYTLWKRFDLLPALSTPSAVIPVLTGGADLMIPGVVQLNASSPDRTRQNSLVSVAKYERGAVGPPLAVGRLVVDGSTLVDMRRKDEKGKAVKVLHVHGDKLWEMGTRSEPPEPMPLPPSEPTLTIGPDSASESGDDETDYGNHSIDSEPLEHSQEPSANPPPIFETSAEGGENESTSLTPDRVSSLLRASLIQALRTTIGSLPSSAFPLPSSTLYSAHILPSRPSFVPAPSATGSEASTPIDIKHSSYKTLTLFLRAVEKDGLLRLKEVKGKGKGKSAGAELLVLDVNTAHPDVVAHSLYTSVADMEKKREKKEEREKAEGRMASEVVIHEMWKPHQQSIRLFEVCEKDSTVLYSLQEVKSILSSYIEANNLVNAHKKQFINVGSDAVLSAVLTSKVDPNVPEFLKREELTQRVVEKMQPWHRIDNDGTEGHPKKGALNRLLLTTKLRQGRQGRKLCTLVTRFEPFFPTIPPLVIADELAEALRKKCAASTSVSPLPGGQGKGLEVMVQGKKIKEVEEVLLAKGVPKKWIECVEADGKKK